MYIHLNISLIIMQHVIPCAIVHYQSVFFECVCFLSSVLMVTRRSIECQRQAELSTTEFEESLNDADTRSEGSDDDHEMNEQEEIIKNKKA